MKALLPLLVLMCSCSAYTYVPDPHFVPQFSKSREVQASASLASVQAGYAITDHLFVTGNGFIRHSQNRMDLSGKRNTSKFMEAESSKFGSLGGGYIQNFGGASVSVLATAGLGTIQYSAEQDLQKDYNFTMDSHRFTSSVQPALGWHPGPFDLLLHYRISKHIYNLRSTTVDLGSASAVRDVDLTFYDQGKVRATTGDFGWTFRIGRRNLKMQLQMLTTTRFTNDPISFRRTNWFVGVYLRVPGRLTD